MVCHRQHLTLPRRGRCQPWLWMMVSPEEVARAVRFLASENASAITGVNLPVDCRWLVTPPRHTYGGSVQRADDGACAASAEAQGGARMVSSMSPIGRFC